MGLTDEIKCHEKLCRLFFLCFLLPRSLFLPSFLSSFSFFPLVVSVNSLFPFFSFHFLKTHKKEALTVQCFSIPWDQSFSIFMQFFLFCSFFSFSPLFLSLDHVQKSTFSSDSHNINYYIEGKMGGHAVYPVWSYSTVNILWIRSWIQTLWSSVLFSSSFLLCGL